MPGRRGKPKSPRKRRLGLPTVRYRDGKDRAQRREIPSEYEAMWLFAMFDLPVDTKENRRKYTQFRKLLLEDGFMMLQYSVYARYCPSEVHAGSIRSELKPRVPADGQVRFLAVTERQFGKMETLGGKMPTFEEVAPEQLLLF